MSSKGFICGGSGGAPLNFKVVGGTEQPTNPKENTIWVNTSTKISSWSISPTEPTEPAEGMVWLKTGTTGSALVDALKKNSLAFYVLQSYQYVGGAWDACFTKVYQNSEWFDTKFWLIKDGQVIENNVGTLQSVVWDYASSAGNSSSINYLEDRITISVAGLKYGKYQGEKTVDASNFSTLYADMESSYNSGYPVVYLGSASLTQAYTRETKRLDISSVGSDAAFAICALRPNVSGTSVFTYYNVWME